MMLQTTHQRFHIKQDIRRIAAAVAAWLVVSVGIHGNALAADEASFLNELNAEAESSSHVQEQRSQEKAKPKSLKEDFEYQLKSERPNTYKFYTKLSADDKAQVLGTFKESHKLPPAARKVLDLYFK